MSNGIFTKNLTPLEAVFAVIGIIALLVASIVLDHYSNLSGVIIFFCLMIIIIGASLIYENRKKKKDENVNHRIYSGLHVIKDSVYLFGRYPKILLPLLFVWLVYAPTILYLKFFIQWSDYRFTEQVGIVAAVIFGFSLLLTSSCLVLLNLLKQQEAGQKMSIIRAVFSALLKDFLKALPIAIVWGIIWLALTIIDAMLSKVSHLEGADESSELSPEHAAEALAGFEEFSLTGAFIDSLKKGVRMIVFLILPAIAWENKSTLKAFKKGTAVARLHFVEFVTGFVGTELVATLIFLPPVVLIVLSAKLHIHLPDLIWYITIIYIGFAWSFSFFLEQMFTAELYLWHLYWEKDYLKAKESGSPISKLSEIRRPSLLDNIADLQVLKQKIR